MSAAAPDERDARVSPIVTKASPEEEEFVIDLHERAARVLPVPGESASSFVARLLARLAPVAPPDFAARLSAQAGTAAEAGHRLRLLSLGSGNAVAERMLLQQCKFPVDLVLTGDDETLMLAALAAFPTRHRISYRVVDFEAGLGRFGERFDIVFSHATLSRLVRLEPLLVDVRKLLVPGGELWLSREYVGRPPDDAGDAGDGRHGDRLLAWLRKHFAPVQECACNGRLWQTLPSSIAVDFDLARADVLAFLRSAAVEDVLHVRSGEPPVMLDAIYVAGARH
jgi:SAM-dependent methyltransferase